MAAYDYSAVSAVTASSILPFGYWNNFISFNASSFHAGITANSARAYTASGVAFEHSARTSGVHGIPAGARNAGIYWSGNNTVAGGSAAVAAAGDDYTQVVVPFIENSQLGGAIFPFASVRYTGAADLRCYIENVWANSAAVRIYKAGAGTVTVTAYVLAIGS